MHPLCHIVEDSDLRFSSRELKEKLNELTSITPSPETQEKFTEKNYLDYANLKEFRIHRMPDCINVVDVEYNK